MPNNINMAEKQSNIQLRYNAQTSVPMDITKGPSSCMTQSTNGQGIRQVTERYISTPMQQPRNLVPHEHSMYEQQMYHHVVQPEVYAHGAVYPGNISSIYGSNSRFAKVSTNSTTQTSSTNSNNSQPSLVSISQYVLKLNLHYVNIFLL
ncbi:hypothetical protein ACHQM5_008759 [Ranunculus cassubicifolius]